MLAAIVAAAGVSIVSTPSPAPQSDPKADALDKARRDATVTDAARLKAALRDPDPLVFEKILASEDGRVVCIRYRARNGFGGMNRERTVFADGPGTTSPTAWNRRCADAALYDETTDTLTTMKTLGRYKAGGGSRQGNIWA